MQERSETELLSVSSSTDPQATSPGWYRYNGLATVASAASVKSYHEEDVGSQPEEHCGGLAVVLANAIVNNCWFVIGAWAVIFASSCCFAQQLLGVLEASYPPQPGMPSFPAKRALDRHFPGAAKRVVDSILFSLEPGVDHFDTIALLAQAVQAVDQSLDEVKRDHPSLILETRSWRGGFEPGESAATYTSHDKRQHLLQVVWDTSGPSGRWRCSRAAGKLLRSVDHLGQDFGPRGLHVVATGPHALQAAAQAEAQRDIGVHAVMFLPLALLAMHTHLHRWAFLPLPAVCSCLAQVLAFALEFVVARWQAVDQNVPTFMAFLCISLCIDWSFFILARFLEEETARGHHGAIVVALSRTGANVALSGCLIAACSACMLLMPPAIASNAVGGTLAVFAALAACLTFMPACLAAMPRIFGPCAGAAGRHSPAMRQTGWYLWACMVTEFPANLGTFLLLSLALGPLAYRLSLCSFAVDTNLGLPPGSPPLLAEAQLRSAFNSSWDQLLILAESSRSCAAGVKSDEHFNATCQTARSALALRDKGKGLGVSFFYKPGSEPEGPPLCLSWRTHFHNLAEAHAAMKGKMPPPGHLLLTGHTRHLYVYPKGVLPHLRLDYTHLWSRLVSQDSSASLMVLQLSWETISWEGFRFMEDLRHLLASHSNNSSKEAGPCGSVRFSEFSETGVWYDYVMTSVRRLPWAIGLACIVTTGCIAGYFRSALAPGKLLLTVVLPLASVYGAAVLFFQDGLLDVLGPSFPLHSSGGLHWMVPCSTSMLLLSLALDYNIFYFGRVAEFRSGGFSGLESIRQGLASTGPVITRAGLIFAVEFAGLLVSSAPLNRQGGFVVVAGILLDTFVVRSCLAPAVLSLQAEWNWWPTHMPQALPDSVEELTGVLVEPQLGDGI